MNQRKRILLYGFGPYRQFRENITVNVIKSLPPVAGLKRLVFPVRFHRGQFVRALEQHKPDVVLGLGQSTRRTIEFETRAINRRRGGKKAKARPIRKGGSRWLPTTLDRKIGRHVKLSVDAGDYVCNFSMYVILEHIRRTEAKTDFGFMHIPHNFALRQAVRIVTLAVAQATRETGTLVGAKSKAGSTARAPSPT